MVRYEVKTPHKSFVGCESTIEEATDYIASLVEAGVEILKVELISDAISDKYSIIEPFLYLNV